MTEVNTGQPLLYAGASCVRIANDSFEMSEWMCLQVEKQGPVLSQQIDTVKRQLGALAISDARCAELRSLRPEQRSLADEVRLCMHDGLAQLRDENEALRVSAQVRAGAAGRALCTGRVRMEHTLTGGWATTACVCARRRATRRTAVWSTRRQACGAKMRGW